MIVPWNYRYKFLYIEGLFISVRKIVLVVVNIKKNGLSGFTENSRILLYTANVIAVLLN